MGFNPSYSNSPVKMDLDDDDDDDDCTCARAWTRHAPWYVPCGTAVCLVCPYFAACFSVSISWLGGGMHEACGLAHG